MIPWKYVSPGLFTGSINATSFLNLHIVRLREGELVRSTPAVVSLCLVDKSQSLLSRQGVVLVVGPVDCASGSHLDPLDSGSF